MKLLAVDTTQAFCSACVLIAQNGQSDAVHSERHRVGRGHAEKLFGIIDKTLQIASLPRSEIDRIAVNTGPGSFTGLRVGIAAARGLALALDCECVGVTTLEALARGCPAGPEDVLVLLDAGRGEVVCQSFTGVKRAVLTPPRTLSTKQASESFRDFSGILTGSGVAACFEDAASLEDRGAVLGFSVFDQDWPDIETIAGIGAEKPADHHPKPFYSRPADAKPQVSANLVAK